MIHVLRMPMRCDPTPSTNGAHKGRSQVGIAGNVKIQNMSSESPFSR